MLRCWMILGEAKRRWVPTQEVFASRTGGLPLDRAHPEPSHRHTLLPSGPRLPFAAARPSKLKERARHEIRP